MTMGTDSDDDGIPDELDAFAFDPAASVDTDGDGMRINESDILLRIQPRYLSL